MAAAGSGKVTCNSGHAHEKDRRRYADLSLNVALTNSDIASPDTIGLRGNDKISKINRKAVSGADRCLCLDVGGVHGNPRSEIRTSSIAAVGPAFALRSSGCV